MRTGDFGGSRGVPPRPMAEQPASARSACFANEVSEAGEFDPVRRASDRSIPGTQKSTIARANVLARFLRVFENRIE